MNVVSLLDRLILKGVNKMRYDDDDDKKKKHKKHNPWAIVEVTNVMQNASGNGDNDADVNNKEVDIEKDIEIDQEIDIEKDVDIDIEDVEDSKIDLEEEVDVDQDGKRKR
jgi:hypothetical protein